MAKRWTTRPPPGDPDREEIGETRKLVLDATKTPPKHCVLALAGDGIWVLEDESRTRHVQIGRVAVCWDRTGAVAHVERSRRAEHFELS